MRFAFTLAAVVLIGVSSASGGPPNMDHKIRKEPVYQTKTPKYGMLLFGMEGKDCVWLVQDGDTLYVDRNGDGDLTEPGKRIVALKRPGQVSQEEGYGFDVGDVTIGGLTHKGLVVGFTPLKLFAGTSLGKRQDVKQALAKDERALAVSLQLDVDAPGLKGNGLAGRAVIWAGPVDLQGILQFGDTPARAPVIWCGGPLEATFYNELPSLRVGRSSQVTLVIGTRGMGPGTFAALSYEGTVPDDARPSIELTVPAKTGGPLKETFEIKGRC